MNEQIAHHIGPDKITMAYEQFGDPAAPAVFLIMGGGAQMVVWPVEFCSMLADKGLYVIRFDNRDAGHSTHFKDGPVPDFQEAVNGDFSKVPYSLSDMAADVAGLMDRLGFSSVHLVGASMGGMIAQTMAIEYQERVRSITSMMSTTGNPAVGKPDWTVLAPLGTPPREDRQAYIDWQLRSLKAIGSAKYPLDEAAVAQRTGLAWDRDHDPDVMLRQAVAALRSGDRTEKLKQLHMPALVIHGDSDKMCDMTGGIATAEAIPNARLVIFEGMGHGLPYQLLGEFADLISEHVWGAELIHQSDEQGK